ncbi:MAG: glycoside hydrolase family 3 C-terminal domain-containing protein [Bacteroidales bacterium]|nr:glycoside hydrolase family 3 C-terminal domain-containing protein [Bacteroidales bacterium]
MKNIKSYISIIIAGIALFSCYGNKVPQLGKASIDKVVAAMTLEEKVHLLVGTGMAGFSGDSAVVGKTKNLVQGAAGTTYPIPRLGIPAIVLADGPAGLRISPTRDGDSSTYYCTAFPVGTLLASTWNGELVEQVGEAIGNEVLEYGADVLLAPALNIHRNPLCGRNFEYYSEDPLLSGKTAAAVVRGVQKNGVGTSIKHFAANNQETNRQRNDVLISERALREIYLRGFEIAVKESQPWTVMSSYNSINGVSASESRALLTDILRNEWGFQGVVMTDWFGGYSPAAQVHAGNDLLMPGRPDQTQVIIQAVNDKKLDIKDIDTNVKRMLELIVKSPRFKGYQYSNKPDLKAHAAITRQSAAEGMVLLKNDNSALPLSAGIKNIAAFGVTSYDFIAGGTGSGDVNEAYTVSLGDGLANAGYQINEEVKSLYFKYISEENEKNKPDPNNPMAMFLPKIRAGEFVPTDALLNKTVQTADVALITIGRTSGEFADRKVDGDFNLTVNEINLIKNVSETFHKAGKKAVVILNIGGVIETASWKAYPDAVLLAWQAGQEGGNSVADILKGEVNPSGKLPMTFPEKLEDVPSYKNFPLDIALNMKELLSGSKPENRPNIDFTNYEEDIYVGYRYYLTNNKRVSYPFGYGLSYTNFEYSAPEISEKKGVYTVTISVKNIGTTAGKEVVQLYVAAPKGILQKPAKELKAFAKTKLLQAGEMHRIELRFSASDIASFDEKDGQWIVEVGNYSIQIGTSSADIRQSVKFTISDEIQIKKNKLIF